MVRGCIRKEVISFEKSCFWLAVTWSFFLGSIRIVRGAELLVNACVVFWLVMSLFSGVKERLFHVLFDGCVCFEGKLCRQNLAFYAVVDVLIVILGDIGDI